MYPNVRGINNFFVDNVDLDSRLCDECFLEIELLEMMRIISFELIGLESRRDRPITCKTARWYHLGLINPAQSLIEYYLLMKDIL